MMRARRCVGTNTGAVARLSRRLDKAIEAGDLDSFRRLMNRMIDIAAMRSPDCTPAAGHAAFRWLSENDGGLLNDAMRRALLRRPDVVAAAIRRLRAIASRATSSPALRRGATALLKRYGYDDESLSAESVDGE